MKALCLCGLRVYALQVRILSLRLLEHTGNPVCSFSFALLHHFNVVKCERVKVETVVRYHFIGSEIISCFICISQRKDLRKHHEQ